MEKSDPIFSQLDQFLELDRRFRKQEALYESVLQRIFALEERIEKTKEKVQ